MYIHRDPALRASVGAETLPTPVGHSDQAPFTRCRGAVGRATVVARTVRDLEGTVPVTGWEIESVARRWDAVKGPNFERHSRDEAAIISCAFWGLMRPNCHMRRHAKSQVATRRKSDHPPWLAEFGRQSCLPNFL